jgi:hypothetical protein
LVGSAGLMKNLRRPALAAAFAMAGLPAEGR